MKKHPYTSIHEFWAKIDRLCTTTHCGYIGRYPENSIMGLQAAVDLGTDFIEFDLRATADNEIVLLHDPTLDRNSNGSGPVNQFTLKELQQFNFSYFEYFSILMSDISNDSCMFRTDKLFVCSGLNIQLSEESGGHGY